MRKRKSLPEFVVYESGHVMDNEHERAKKASPNSALINFDYIQAWCSLR